MKTIFKLLPIILITLSFSNNLDAWKPQLNKLSQFERNIVVDKGTERAFSGKYVNTSEKGVYKCKVCGKELYTSNDKFKSDCGWPSFDDAIPGAIKETTDEDGIRIEITCANCGAHMGHIFKGEHQTKKNVRHCVNSASLNFSKAIRSNLSKAYFAGGCFWGVEYYMKKINGVKEVTSGFMGGKLEKPTYKDVIKKNTGHLETVEVIYDPKKVSYKKLAKTFFEIHDPTQKNGQGPDIGSQYLSAIFVSNKNERDIVKELINILEKKNFKIATKIKEKKSFYSAEEYHQDHYKKKGGQPYCHSRMKRFD